MIRAALLGALAAASTLGCVSASTRPDLGRVRELSRIERLPAVPVGEVDPVATREAQQLLAEPLDVEAAVRVALLDNRELRATLRSLGIARGRLLQASLLPNPVVEAELLPERNTQLELRVEYDLTRALLTPLRVSAEAPELDAARYRAAAAVVELSYQVRTAFYGLQVASERLALAERALDASTAGRDFARALLEAGNVDDLVAAQQEVAHERTRIEVAKFELELVMERERLQRLLGNHGKATEFRVNGGLAALPASPAAVDDPETRALRASLELSEAKQRLEGLARQAGATRTAGLVPDVAVDVHALSGDPSGHEASDDPAWRFGAGVSVTLPLFDRQQGTATALEAEFDALLERYYGMAIDVRSAAREVSQRVASLWARAHQYEQVIVPAQRRVTQQTLLQYNAMQLGLPELLLARREELSAEMARVQTLGEYWSARAELSALLAGQRVARERRSPAAALFNGADAPGAH